MRTVTLELLRHGPPHNQLLSPLTQYLALCENHAGVTVHVPFEHNQFLYRLSALGYRLGPESRRFQLSDTARVLGELLGKIPGLAAELNRSDSGPRDNLLHLRLVISASELALLPFELAISPNGCPGAGQPLLLQSQVPICLTREVRRVAEEQMDWGRRPKILFVAAAPPDVGTIPVESHLLAMRKAIDPWVKYFDSKDPNGRRRRIEDHLVFLPEATARSIEEMCATGQFTHIHILAHGVRYREGEDTRFGLALHNAVDPGGPRDVVSGPRLATILRPVRNQCGRDLMRPAVVTLASCDSGNVGSVAGAGSSVAHALHDGGIPIVVAGQFPLSFEGSVRMVQVLYECLLWGKDPRPVLNDLRRQLHSDFPKTHDWACITAYASFPTDFERRLDSVQIERANQSVNAAMNHADEVTRRFGRKRKASASAESPETYPERFKNTQHRIDIAKERLRKLLSATDHKATIYGLLGSAEKRQAEVLFASTQISTMAEAHTHNREASKRALAKARDFYWASFLNDRSGSWAVVQYLSLTVVLIKNNLLSKEVAEREGNLADLWSMGHILSVNDINSTDRKRQAWAHGNLLELYLLASWAPEVVGTRQDAAVRALEHSNQLIALAGVDSFEVYSTRRQIIRYIEWFGTLLEGEGQAEIPLAEQLYDRFPQGVEEIWS